MDDSRSPPPLPDAPGSHVAWLDPDGVIVDVNEAWRQFAEHNDLRTPRHAVGSSYLEACVSARGAYSDGARDVARGIEGVLAGKRSRFAFEYPCHGPTRRAWFRLVAAPAADGRAGCVVAHRDVSFFRLREMGQQAIQIERLEQLVGEVAHRYNNLLQVVLGFGALLADRDAAEHAGPLDEIVQAAVRGGEIGAKLIAFGGGEVRRPGVVELHRVAADACRRFRTRCPAGVRLHLEEPPQACPAFADEAQIGRAVDEILDNALRAVSDRGGVVTVSAAPEVVDRLTWERHPGVPAGEYTALAVEDSGPGMDGGMRERAFEPFFTTDPLRSGLGLSVAYGLVRQNGGFLLLDSETGGPTRCRILLPPPKRS